MRTVSTTRELAGNIELVWAVMTDRRDLSWRGDLVRLQVAPSEQGDILIETLQSGLTARFLVTVERPPLEYEQTLTGSALNRSWGFTLTAQGPDRTRVTLKETYSFHSRLMLFLSYLYLHPREGQKAQLKNLAAILARRVSSDGPEDQNDQEG